MHGAPGDEKQMYDKDDLQNQWTLMVVAIPHLYHEMYRFDTVKEKDSCVSRYKDSK